MLIEVKDRDGVMGPDIGPLEAATLAALAGYAGDVAVMSFNPHSVARIHRDAPHLPRGLVTAAFEERHWPDLPAATRARLAGIPDYERVGACFVSHQADALAHAADRRAEGGGRRHPVLDDPCPRGCADGAARWPTR